jgi:hypothetical protein
MITFDEHPVWIWRSSDARTTTNWSVLMITINDQIEPPPQRASQVDLLDTSDILLLDVDFKWLMAGFGWWVDTTRIHRDQSYASKCLNSAMTSESLALRNCAAKLFSIHPAAWLTAVYL